MLTLSIVTLLTYVILAYATDRQDTGDRTPANHVPDCYLTEEQWDTLYSRHA